MSPEQLEQQARSHRAQMAIYGDWQIVLSYSPRARDGIGKWWRHEPTGRVPRSRVPDNLDLPPLAEPPPGWKEPRLSDPVRYSPEKQRLYNAIKRRRYAEREGRTMAPYRPQKIGGASFVGLLY